jgi:hypothetical protein
LVRCDAVSDAAGEVAGTTFAPTGTGLAGTGLAGTGLTALKAGASCAVLVLAVVALGVPVCAWAPLPGGRLVVDVAGIAGRDDLAVPALAGFVRGPDRGATAPP